MSTQPTRRRTGSLLDGLADIAQDLWASLPESTPGDAPGDAPSATPDASPSKAASLPTAETPSDAPAAFQPVSLPFTNLWSVADEPIDWTEVLSSATPTDAFTTQEKWTRYRQWANQVLAGDTDVYLQVLKAVNPMADLTAYTQSLSVTTRSSDVVEAVFCVRDDLLENDGEHYLCGLSLRIARDLFATLPINHVIVIAKKQDTICKTIDFSRAALHGVRFAFINPVDFVNQL